MAFINEKGERVSFIKDRRYVTMSAEDKGIE